MTLQELLDKERAKKKMQTGGQVGVTTINPASQDLSQKTIRDPAPPTNATSPTIPGAPKTDTPKTANDMLGSKGNPMYMIQTEGEPDNRSGKTGFLSGMQAGKDKFGMVGAVFGGVTGFLGGLNRKMIDKHRANAAPIAAPVTAEHGVKLVPKAQLGGGIPGGMGSDQFALMAMKAYNSANAPKAIGLDRLKTANIGYQSSNKLMPNKIVTGNAAKAQQRQMNGGGGGGANAIGGAASAVSMAGDFIESMKPIGPMNTWGIETQTKKGNKMGVAASTLQGAGKGAAMGASIGSVIPGVGTAIGAGVGFLVGGISGLIKGKKKVKDEAKNIQDETDLAYQGYHQKANANQYASMGGNSYIAQRNANAAVAKCGAKLSTMDKIKSSKKDKVSMKNRKFKSGGRLNSLGETNIIPSGKLHKENNNLGKKDKGIPIIDKDGKKVFEVEKEELILRLKTTKSAEDLTAKYKKTHNDRHLIDLGKLLAEEINNNTHDFSGRYGLEVQ